MRTRGDFDWLRVLAWLVIMVLLASFCAAVIRTIVTIIGVLP